MNINLQQILVLYDFMISQNRANNDYSINIFANNRKLLKFATTNNLEKKKIISNMHHRIAYMYINFQQIRVSGSVKTVLINIFANNRKWHKFATIIVDNRSCTQKL